jgi:hypothetical protein
MSMKALALLLLLVCVSAEDDFQQRLIYLSERDNVCRQRTDKVKISVVLDDLDWLDLVGNGGTSCYDGIKYSDNIKPAKTWWAYIEKDYKNNQVYFQDESMRYTAGGVLMAIVQKSRVTNATFNGLPYKCRVYGDGKIQHFGIDIPDQMPAAILIGCNKITGEGEAQQTA